MTSTGERKTDADVSRVAALCQLKRYDEAATLARRIVALDGANAHAWCLLAQAELGRGDNKAALAAASGARSLDPDQEWPHRLAGYALEALGRNDEAVASAHEAVRLGPHQWQGYVTLAAFLRSSGSEREALAVAERAIAIAPHEAQTHLTYAMVAGAAGRRNDAESALRRALELDPQNSAAHNELARLQLRRGTFARPDRLATAASTFGSAIRLDPHEAVIRRNLDTVLFVFMRRVAWFVLIVGLIAGTYFSSRSVSPAARLVPILLLGVPAAFAWRFWEGLTPDLRRHLRELVLGRRLRVATSLLTVAVLCLVGAVAVPGLALGSFWFALFARLSLRRYGQRAQVAKRQVDYERAVRVLLWLLAGGLGLVALELLAGVEGLEGFPRLFVGLLCAGGSVMALRTIRRRSAR